MQLVQRRLSLAVLLALIFAALPSARPTYAQAGIVVTNLLDTDNDGTNDCHDSHRQDKDDDERQDQLW